jgi:nucleotide-binding universal stress UspA family protein
MTIVVGYVPTPEGDAALTAAIDEARRRSETLHVLNAARGDASGDTNFLDDEAVATLRGRLADSGVGFEVQQLVRGRDAADEIVEAAERVGASLVVIGIRRRTPTGKLLFGSQAQKVLLEADRPVLAVKAAR